MIIGRSSVAHRLVGSARECSVGTRARAVTAQRTCRRHVPESVVCRGGGGAGFAYRRKEEPRRRFHGIGRNDWQNANRSRKDWQFYTGKAVITLLRADNFSELIPYGLMDSAGWVGEQWPPRAGSKPSRKSGGVSR